MTARDRSGGVAHAVGEAIADIREKLVEEGWFGRTLSPRPISDALDVAHDRSDESTRDRPGHEPRTHLNERDVIAERNARARPISEALGWGLPNSERPSPELERSPDPRTLDQGIDR